MESRIKGKLLVIAGSARMLTQMARASGYLPIAVDCYADADTQELAVETVRVKSLALIELEAPIEALARKYHFEWVVYGSGFECHADSLVFLASRWRLLGNSADLLGRFQDKRDFFHCLATLKIDHPETVFSPPTDNTWLQKPLRGEGGEGISFFQPGNELGGEFYWQRFTEGEVYSLLFLAAGGLVKILGFNRQWSEALGQYRPFLFAGICNHARIAAWQRRQLKVWLDKIATTYPLSGLGSLDFIICGERCYVLELNARIPASAQLYGKTVFDLHVQACLERTGALQSRLRARPLGYQIVFAKVETLIGAGLEWPGWVVDRPPPGANISAGQPICSIIAGGKNARQVRNRLQARQNYLETHLITGC